MTGATATKAIDVSIAGAAQLRLVVTNGGDNVPRPRRLGRGAHRVRRLGPRTRNARFATANWHSGDVKVFLHG